MNRPLWVGSLGFGLMNIPVKIQSALTQHDLELGLLHAKDLAPIRYTRMCSVEGKEVQYDEVVKGYEYRKGKYVVLDEEDLENVDIHKSRSIDIKTCIDPQEINPLHYERPYYLHTNTQGAKAYDALREALRASGKVGLVTFVLRNREHVGIIKPEGSVLALIQLRFQTELLKPKGTPPTGAASTEEIEAAKRLVKHLQGAFDPSLYTDEYSEQLKKAIVKKVKGEMIQAQGSVPTPTRASEVMQALKASVSRQKQRHH